MQSTVPRFRLLVATDADLVVALQELCFDEAWTAAAFRTLLSARGTWGLIASRDGETGPDPLGYVLVRGAREEAEILSLGIVPERRRSGLGRALLEATAREAMRRGAQSLFLEVAADNRAGCALYRAGGFRPVGQRPGYYRRPGGRPVNAVVMRLDLSTYTSVEVPANGKQEST